MNSGKVVTSALIGILLGGAVGAIIGILFAPEKGSTTRRRLALQGGYYVDDLHDKFDHLTHSIEEKFDSITGGSPKSGKGTNGEVYSTSPGSNV